MGIGVDVSCDCFGTFKLQLGSGLPPKTASWFPFLCRDCRQASNLDIHAASLACSHCKSGAVVPFGSAEAVGKLGPGIVFRCGPTERFSVDELTLTDGTYWCPTCRRFTATFRDAGILWD